MPHKRFPSRWEISAATQEMAGTEDTHESFKKMAEITVDTSMDTHEIAESVSSQHMLWKKWKQPLKAEKNRRQVCGFM